MPDLEGAQVVELAHDTLDECGFTFSVFADECYFLSAADGESDVMEDIVFTKILSQVFHNERKIATSRGRRETQVETRGVFQIHLQSLEFLQLFDAALYLYGFGGFIAESLDEILGVLNHLLLVLVGADLLLVAFFPEFHKTAVIDVIIVDAAEGYFYRAWAGVVYERAVVGYHEYGGRAGLEEVLEPLDRLDVKVVGRLVKEE